MAAVLNLPSASPALPLRGPAHDAAAAPRSALCPGRARNGGGTRRGRSGIRSRAAPAWGHAAASGAGAKAEAFWDGAMGTHMSLEGSHEDRLCCRWGQAAVGPAPLWARHHLASCVLASAQLRSASHPAGPPEALPQSSRSGEASGDGDVDRDPVGQSLLTQSTAATAQDGTLQESSTAQGPGAAATAGGSGPPLIILPGGGMFFYWQLGALGALARRFDVSRFHYEGASAGALAGALAVCGVDGPHAAEAAFRLTMDNRVWDRPAGLAGVWGGLVREWLDGLLPADAAELCSSRLALQVFELPSLSQRDLHFRHTLVTSFGSKQDVLDCCMASVHIPFFMDGRLCSSFRGRRCIDGSFLAPPHHKAAQRRPQRTALVLDYTLDEEMKQRRWEFLSLGDKEGGHASTWDWITEMMVRGAEYVDALSDSGALDSFKLEPEAPQLLLDQSVACREG